MRLKGRAIYRGTASGEALVTTQPISLYGGVDPDSGLVIEKGHELQGRCVRDRILVFPSGKGSTVGSYTLYRMRKRGVAPAGIINQECEPIVAVGAIISSIPCVDRIDIAAIRPGAQIRIDGEFVELVGSVQHMGANPRDKSLGDSTGGAVGLLDGKGHVG